ncbi:uncharacterized protein LOC144341268 [Macaca mulatta]
MIVAGGAQPWSARLGLGMVEERQSCLTKAIWRARSSLLGSLRRAPHLRVPYPLTPTPAQRHLTCSSSSGGSLASPQGQLSDVLARLQPAFTLSRSVWKLPNLRLLRAGLSGCRFLDTEVRVASFQKLGKQEGQLDGSVKNGAGFLVRYFFFFPSKTSPSFAVPAGLVRWRTAFRCEATRAGGAEPRSPVLAALRPSHGQLGQLPEFAAAAEAAPGYLGAARGPLCPRRWPGAVHLPLGLPRLELRSRLSTLCTNFSPPPSFPGGGGGKPCAARTPIGRIGRGRSASSLGAAGEPGGGRCSGWGGAGLRGAGRLPWFSRPLSCGVGAGRRPWEAPVLSPATA